MAKLAKYTLEYNEKNGRWALKNDTSKKTEKSFKSKSGATKGGTLKRALGVNGGSVKIKKVNGRVQEVRAYPSR